MAERMKTRPLLHADEILGTKARPPELKRKPAPAPNQQPEVRPHTGRPTDAEILELAADGLENAQIGVRLKRPTGYIKHRMEKINARLGARNRAHAVALFLREKALK